CACSRTRPACATWSPCTAARCTKDERPMPLKHEARELLSLLAYVYLENNRPEKTAVLLNALRALGLAGTRELATLALAQLRAGKAEAALSTLEALAMQGG